MEMTRIYSMEEFYNLPKNKWGIPEHLQTHLVESCFDKKYHGLDLIIVPGLGFDRNGNRLGHGKGYYDKFYTRCLQMNLTDQKQIPYLLAVCLSEQLVDFIPHGDQDVVMNAIITQEGEIFKKN
ncbi:hypothetical protein BB559_002240 [Furculomyces boomerangus]|uniref:5-formyltetrahydrofolate cyclo-ligase n=2 Tax=Harpellales TaxID=61421 RepID=A0A2T9YX21_9FUNG|nr:hypothetical protein BB559_002240 [Furculomyces boomerangus]PVZ97817.1 hypothetical protein BB558_006215 [Smittium angustum]